MFTNWITIRKKLKSTYAYPLSNKECKLFISLLWIISILLSTTTNSSFFFLWTNASTKIFVDREAITRLTFGVIMHKSILNTCWSKKKVKLSWVEYFDRAQSTSTWHFRKNIACLSVLIAFKWRNIFVVYYQIEI